jgi:hypothetical protein
MKKARGVSKTGENPAGKEDKACWEKALWKAAVFEGGSDRKNSQIVH